MAFENEACLLTGEGKLEIGECPTPGCEIPNGGSKATELKSGQVLLKTNCVGLCGSDVHWWLHGRIGSKQLVNLTSYPFVLGHETAATVLALGPDVTNLKVGDRVAVEPGLPCRTCALCKEGKYNLCQSMQFLGSPPVWGSLRRQFIHAADLLVPLPENVSLKEGAMVEPLSVALYACEKAGISSGKTVFIAGAGPIGLVTVLAARAAGATTIIISDLAEDRLAKARSIGATHALNAKEITTESLRKLAGNDGVDCAIDCVGFEPTFQGCLEACRPGGVCVMVGMGASEIKIPVMDTVSRREVDVRGVFRYRNVYPKAVQLLSAGQIDVKPLITHSYPFSKVTEAFEHSKSMADGAIKVMVDFDL